ncbi:o-succinylbenzoate synthase [Acerihabitans arboris]|uniref:o-succinylbenzoate synthase n=1 Tax=Acerihabitans arboris TaxID=2691583 RepID=A0A845SMP3_9GAMM|nr:o-succinylbenzoate synthase [Acerihabitans arboris]NDL65269.1 o-succinylbenzoate synthase [Acerihabitans arboris]
MRRATLYHYSLPMEAGVVLRNQRLKSRDGLVVRLERDGRQGEGEIAPLPGFSRETLAEAGASALEILRRWVNGEDPLADGPGLVFAAGAAVPPAPPSAAFGISMALAELDQSLPDAAPYQTVPLCTGDPDGLIPLLAALPGRKIAKVKVGMYEAIRDSVTVNLLLDAVPDLHLRLDANRSWTPAKAAGFARYLDPAHVARIDFLEEPCATPGQSLAFAHDTGIAIAWDESLRDAGLSIQARPGLAAVVIKPMLTGGLSHCRALVEQAHRAGLVAVISSAIESSLGLTQLSRLAAWLTPGVQPGLDTLSLMRSQLIRPWPGSPLPLSTHGELFQTLLEPVARLS